MMQLLVKQEAAVVSIDYEALKQAVLQAAKECAGRGPGYSQQRPVLDTVATTIGGGNMWTRLPLELQQAILTCWHDLFQDGALSWGYDLDNPDPPFFHIPERTAVVEAVRPMK
jgi:hypothetical protein